METPQLIEAEQPGRSAAAVAAGRLSPSVAGEALAAARREALQLPVLRQGRPSHKALPSWDGVALRLQCALWEVAASADVPVRPGASIDAVARLLVGHGAVIPPAGDAVRVLASLADAAPAGVDVAEAASVAERLAGYLALRARFG